MRERAHFVRAWTPALLDPLTNALLARSEEALATLGARIVMASSGEEALRRVLEDDFAAILMDVRMPGIDGFTTATLIRERARSRNTPIIFKTAAMEDVGAMFRGYRAGAVDYLAKPVVPACIRPSSPSVRSPSSGCAHRRRPCARSPRTSNRCARKSA
jgi:CheY-like chemotaxis protein